MTVAIDRRPDPHERQDARVAAVQVDGSVRPPQHGLDLPHLLDVRAAEGLHDARAARRARRGRGLDALLRLLGAGRRRGPRAVADPRRGAVQRRGRARRAGHHRRPAERPADHAAADLRARAPARAAARRAAVALRARRQGPTGQPPTTGAERREDGESNRRAGGACSYDDDHPRRRGHRHRQHLRQVRLLEPGRQEADGGLRAHAGRAVGEGLAALACSTSAAARACSRTSGRSACATAASSASTSRTRRSRPSGPSARRRTSSTRS